VHQVGTMGVAKWNMKAFNHFNDDGFSVAACNTIFGWYSPDIEQKIFATMVLICEKKGNKM
jgi:hypothetical protein